MSAITTEGGGPLLDGIGSDAVLQDGSGLVFQTGTGELLVLGGTGNALDDGLVASVPSTVDTPGMALRIRALLPDRWFGDQSGTPVLGAVLGGLGAGWAAIYGQITFAGLQTRIATATGPFLDLVALDFLRGRLVRRAGEPDPAFSARIRAEIIRPRATRAALVQVLTDLTGRAPKVFEPARPTDTGGYGAPGMTAGTGLGYGLAGGWGALNLPSQVFVHAYRATGGGIANVAGYYAGSGPAAGGYGVGAIEWASPSLSQGQVTDADIYAAVSSVLPAGGIGWTAITT